MRREVVWTFDLGPFLRETFPSDEAPAADAKVWLVVRTEHSDGTSGKVIETHSSYTFVDAQGGAYRPGCTVRWSSGSLGENGNLYPTLSQAGEGLENGRAVSRFAYRLTSHAICACFYGFGEYVAEIWKSG
jgi:hypothetical protein